MPGERVRELGEGGLEETLKTARIGVVNGAREFFAQPRLSLALVGRQGRIAREHSRHRLALACVGEEGREILLADLLVHVHEGLVGRQDGDHE